MKLAYIEGTFPELPSGKMYQVARGTGGTTKVAIARGVGSLLKQVKGRRISAIKLSIVISEVEKKGEA